MHRSKINNRSDLPTPSQEMSGVQGASGDDRDQLSRPAPDLLPEPLGLGTAAFLTLEDNSSKGRSSPFWHPVDADAGRRVSELATKLAAAARQGPKRAVPASEEVSTALIDMASNNKTGDSLKQYLKGMMC